MPSFDEQSVRRIARTVQESERRLRGRRQKRARWHGRGGGGGTLSVRFQVEAAGPFLGDINTPECDFVVATILALSCGGSGVAIGEEVNVWDPSRCHFNLPIATLVGAHGFAVNMVSDLTGVDCIDERASEGACHLVVVNLCCTEEIFGSGS